MPDIYGPWWMAAQIFIRWSRLGVLEQLLHLAQRCGISLGMRFLDGTSIRAHQKAAGPGSGNGVRLPHDTIRPPDPFSNCFTSP